MHFPSPVTKLLTSIMQCWAQRKMVSSSNSRHIQRWSLSSESTPESSLRSVRVVITSMCVCILVALHSLLTERLFFSDVYILRESPSIWWQHFRKCLQPFAQWWTLRNKAGKPDRVDRGTANLFLVYRW